MLPHAVQPGGNGMTKTNFRFHRPRINPVMLKELRQLVRSRVVMFVLFGMLAAQLLCAMGILASQDMSSVTSLLNKDVGEKLFKGLFIVLEVALYFGVTGYMVFRLLMESSQVQLDLQYTTTLKPCAFVDGKIATAATLMMMLASVSLPFLVLSYFLRGVDLVHVGFMTGLLLVLETGFLFVAFYLVTLSQRLGWRLMAVVAVLAGAVGLLYITVEIFEEAEHIDLVEASLILITMTVIFATLCLMLRAGALSAFAPPQSNRDLAQRVWWLGCITVTGIGAGIVDFLFHDNGEPVFLDIWLFFCACAFVLSMLREVSQPDNYSRRIRSKISGSRKGLARPVQFLLFSGGINGMLWTLCIASLVCGFACVSWMAWNSRQPNGYGDNAPITLVFYVIMFYVFAYILTIRAVWFGVFSRRVSPYYLWLVVILLVAAGSIAPYLLAMLNDTSHPGIAFGNVFVWVFTDNYDASDTLVHCAWSGIWFVCAVLATLPEIVVAWRRFVPLEETVAPVASEGMDE